MIINHNMMAMNAHRQLSVNNGFQAKSLEKLSSGYRINRAGDDAAGLSISEKMRAQIRGLNMASKNAQDGISLIQTAEGALTESHAILQRMRELAVQSANGTNEAEDRTALNDEIAQLQKELDRIAESTEFNKQKLLNGTLGNAVDTNAGISTVFEATGVLSANSNGLAAGTWTITKGDGTVVPLGAYTITDGTTTLISNVQADATAGTITFGDGKLTIKVNEAYAIDSLDTKAVEIVGNGISFQIGANKADDQKMSISIGKMNSEALGVKDVSIETQAKSLDAIGTIDDGLQKISAQRSLLGAAQNRLEYTVRNLDNVAENLQASESRIRDVDMAKEMMNYTKQNILQQAATAMLAQANQVPQGVLQLLR